MLVSLSKMPSLCAGAYEDTPLVGFARSSVLWHETSRAAAMSPDAHIVALEGLMFACRHECMYSVRLYVGMYVCMYVCTQVCALVRLRVRRTVKHNIYIYIYLFIFTYIYIYVYVHVCAGTQAC